MVPLVSFCLLLLSLFKYTVAQNNGSLAGAIYMNPSASVDDRVQDLLSRMTLEEKIGQLMQGDVSNWLNTTTGAFNMSGLVDNMQYKAGSFYVGYPIPWTWFVEIPQYQNVMTLFFMV